MDMHPRDHQLGEQSNWTTSVDAQSSKFQVMVHCTTKSDMLQQAAVVPTALHGMEQAVPNCLIHACNTSFMLAQTQNGLP